MYTTFKQVVHDYAVTGLGYMYVYVDPEADYGRLRDDRYGKGLNTITKEKLEREKKCFEDGMY